MWSWSDETSLYRGMHVGTWQWTLPWLLWALVFRSQRKKMRDLPLWRMSRKPKQLQARVWMHGSLRKPQRYVTLHLPKTPFDILTLPILFFYLILDELILSEVEYNSRDKEEETISVFQPQNGGPKIDCVVDEWTDWTPCSVSCGVGKSVKMRMVKIQPQNGGRPCPKRLLKKRVCQGPPCWSFPILQK